MLTFEESYPNKPPTVKFLTKMFHPNVYANGELCLDILQNRWSPTYDVAAILTSIQSLLHDPNPNRQVLRWREQRSKELMMYIRSPANAEAAQLFRDNMKVRSLTSLAATALLADCWLAGIRQARKDNRRGLVDGR